MMLLRPLWRRPSSLTLFAFACTSPLPGAPSAADDRGPREVVVSLPWPPGIMVTIDGIPRGMTPLEGVRLVEGEHLVQWMTACDLGEGVVILDDDATTLATDQLPDLLFAGLHVNALDREEAPLDAELEVDGRIAGSGPPGYAYLVTRCWHRTIVRHQGLGGTIADLDLSYGALNIWTPLLLPGGDSVLLVGGPLTLEPDRGPLVISRYPPQHIYIEPKRGFVESFMIDRHEVTTAEFLECRKAGGCPFDPNVLSHAKVAPRKLLRDCTTDFRQANPEPVPGRENFAMNCLTRKDAENYCQWVGKRLLTDLEWQYAARSGNYLAHSLHWDEPYEMPWGSEPIELPDSRRAEVPLGEVCRRPQENSEQGVCDLMSNVTEHIQIEEDAPPETRSRCRGWNPVGADLTTFGPPKSCSSPEISPFIGFRCGY